MKHNPKMHPKTIKAISYPFNFSGTLDVSITFTDNVSKGNPSVVFNFRNDISKLFLVIAAELLLKISLLESKITLPGLKKHEKLSFKKN